MTSTDKVDLKCWLQAYYKHCTTLFLEQWSLVQSRLSFRPWLLSILPMIVSSIVSEPLSYESFVRNFSTNTLSKIHYRGESPCSHARNFLSAWRCNCCQMVFFTLRFVLRTTSLRSHLYLSTYRSSAGFPKLPTPATITDRRWCDMELLSYI